MAPNSSTLAWKIPWMEEPGRLQSMGWLRVGHGGGLHFHFSLSCIGERNGTHSSVLARRIPGTVEPGRLPSMGSHRVGHNWSNLAAAAATHISGPPLSFLGFSNMLLLSHSFSFLALPKGSNGLKDAKRHEHSKRVPRKVSGWRNLHRAEVLNSLRISNHFNDNYL